VEEIRRHPERLYPDLGAGLRHVYYSNVVNTEIYSTISTDVICVGEELPFADAQFDSVFAIAVLEHTMRPWEVAREICRVLKPGGTVLIDFPFLQAVHGYPHHYFQCHSPRQCKPV
jgi:SAM-dependent methyltransferase